MNGTVVEHELRVYEIPNWLAFAVAALVLIVGIALWRFLRRRR